VLKHSRAYAVTIRLTTDDHATSLTVQDNGIGCVSPPAEAPQGPSRSGGGFGLAIMRERAEALGGSVHVRAAPGAGTRVEVRLPR
jgi:signal transduction histidine kinase